MDMVSLSGVIPVTAVYAGVHGLLAVVLANFVLFVRLRPEAPKWQADAAMRAQGNFIENVPMALLLLLVLEIQGLPSAGLHICGCLLFILRCLHAFGLGTIPKPNYPRLIGAQGTFVLLAVMAVACLVSALT